MEKSKTYLKLIRYSLRLVSKKRYTISGMKEKLEKFVSKLAKEDEDLGDCTSDIKDVLGRLEELEYLDDAKFVKDFVSERARFKPRGKFLLRRELQKKGIEKDLLNESLEACDFDETKAAQDCLRAKIDKWKERSIWDQKKKAFQFLQSRGFSGDTIYKAVECCYNRGEDQDLK